MNAQQRTVKPPRANQRRRSASSFLLVAAVRLIYIAALVGIAAFELRTSYVQSHLFTDLAKNMSYSVEAGASPAVRFPTDGPYDRRLGYTRLPDFNDALTGRGFVIERQAWISPALERFMELGGYAVYPEKTRTGLTLRDRTDEVVFTSRHPSRSYESFAAIPPLIVDTLQFIENRELLDPRHPNRNPAIEWRRAAAAAVGQVGGLFDPSLRTGGGSTLATQIEKFRHSPGGRTESIDDKLWQVATASLRAYMYGRDTTVARQDTVVAYLNSTPLGARSGSGEIIGLGDGLWTWYGTDFDTANRILREEPRSAEALMLKAQVYKQVLSLLLAQRRPSFYLTADHGTLSALADHYLTLLESSGLIDPALSEATRRTALRFLEEVPAPAAGAPFIERKAANAIRRTLLSLLRLSSLYELDRLDLTAETSIDTASQQRVTTLLSKLNSPAEVKELGLVGPRLLGRGDPAGIHYSLVLYERGADRNYVRIQTDTLNEPFDVNTGAKLILGSTAKLRTLVSYLNVTVAIHQRYGEESPSLLNKVAGQAKDPLTRWAVGWLATSRDRSLRALLDAAMERRYSASPTENFYTGGGVHTFENFDPADNHRILSVAEAFHRSVNLVFIRLMRDVVRYHMAAGEQESGRLVADGSEDPARRIYLEKFAEWEGAEYLNRFFDDYSGLTPDDVLKLIAGRTRPAPHRLAVTFRSVRPQADLRSFHDFLAGRLRSMPDDATVAELYKRYAPDRFSLSDRGYIAGVHPLELWLAGYFQERPNATRREVLEASTAERREAYAWLFRTRNKRMQDIRIRTMLERAAFDRIHEEWQQLGYPFGQLVPSYASALGSSGDRPDALAELMGIIVNGGVRQPAFMIERLRFAADTPYETEFGRRPTITRVLAPEVADVAYRALRGVVEQGTAQRLRGAFKDPDGKPLAVGAKTGTGDNRFGRYAADGRLIDSRVVNRTATLIFFIGDRFFGALTAYVPGVDAAEYRFTSALNSQLLKALEPSLRQLLHSPAPELPVTGLDGARWVDNRSTATQN